MTTVYGRFLTNCVRARFPDVFSHYAWTDLNSQPTPTSLSQNVYACLQNDRGLFCATAVTRGENTYRSKSQHRKLGLEKKILPPSLPGNEPAAVCSQIRRSTTEPDRHPKTD